MFKIGQEIVCVDDRPGHESGEKLLSKHKQYMVAEIDSDGDVRVYGVVGWWFSERFRPLSDVLAEISLT